MIGPDGVEYWTTKQAAAEMDVLPATIASWRRKAYLAPIEGSPRSRPLYRKLDVTRAEKAAYDAAIRTSGSRKRTARAA
ncbi:MAG: hypothetical protein JWN52_3577 [Actinomycetia bacterium]|nr:hypothetical protein [Actinomycetes bacterium]